MQYTILVYETEAELAARTDPKRKDAYWGAALEPPRTATTVRQPGGKRRVQDGPFAETKEQIAGFDIIECADLQEALRVAGAHPTTRHGTIEVQPFPAE